jgi:hypothetical protein
LASGLFPDASPISSGSFASTFGGGFPTWYYIVRHADYKTLSLEVFEANLDVVTRGCSQWNLLVVESVVVACLSTHMDTGRVGDGTLRPCVRACHLGFRQECDE